MKNVLNKFKANAKKLNVKSVINAVIRALPIVVCALIIAVYLGAPNKILPPTPFAVIEFTNTWAGFIGAFALFFFVWNIIALFFERARKRLQKGAPIYTVIFVLFLLYDVAVLKLAIFPQPFFPWPDAILRAMISDSSMLLKSLGHSLSILLIGYIIGGGLGIVLGVSAGLMARARQFIRPFARFFSSVPIVTWVPIMVFIPIGFYLRAVFLIALGVSVPVTLMTMNGVLAIPKSTIEAARTFGIGKAAMIYKVAVPASAPSIFNGLAAGMGVACTALIIAEMMGVPAGIGWYMDMQRGFLNYAAMYGAIVVLSLTFFAVNAVLNFIKKYALRWKAGKDL
ncbi:MAG: ABC transporter permease subunit [Firmicutes bacterium]|nr:ABC transporter permease subunit [Bacillota bacterium]